jgi:tetratricopeptide (TPR) repeat protein
MKLIYYFSIALLLVTGKVFGQSEIKTARDYYRTGCEKIVARNYRGAISDFDEAIKLDTAYLEAYENRGVARYYLQDMAGAISDYTKALILHPTDYNTYGRRGWAEFYSFNYKEAIADFTRTISGVSNNRPFYNIRGQAKYMVRDYNGAIRDFDAVIKSWTVNRYEKRKAYYWRGLAKISMGQKDEGCLDLSKSVKMGNPDAFEAIKEYCQ